MDGHPSREDLFEQVYAAADADAAKVPWALLGPSPQLLDWLDSASTRSPATGPGEALVVACGLGDDAEELAGRGWQVTGFDSSATAIDWARRRFPATGVDYRVADLFAMPGDWHRRFDLVVEIRTLQSVESARRPDAVRAIAETVAPGGRLFVHCLLREEAEEATEDPPQPLARSELAGFGDSGLIEVEATEIPPADGRGRSLSVAYRRASRAAL